MTSGQLHVGLTVPKIILMLQITNNTNLTWTNITNSASPALTVVWFYLIKRSVLIKLHSMKTKQIRKPDKSKKIKDLVKISQSEVWSLSKCQGER